MEEAFPESIVVFFGGRSGEHEISLISGATVVKGLQGSARLHGVWVDHSGGWFYVPEETLLKSAETGKLSGSTDPAHLEMQNGGCFLVCGKERHPAHFAFPALHGTFGEDGRIQGLFEMYNLPYAGPGVLGSALAMDKIVCREILRSRGFPQVDSVSVLEHEYRNDPAGTLAAIIAALPFPIFVKPANLGSSVGVSKTRSEEELRKAIELALRFDSRLIVEEGKKVRELEVALLGNADDVWASPVGEVIVHADFYSYDAKYLNPADSELSVPAKIPDAVAAEIRDLAARAFRDLACEGFGRADFFYCMEENRVYFNELNTIPGLTPASLFPRLWKEAGLDLAAVMNAIVRAGMRREEARRRLSFRYQQ